MVKVAAPGFQSAEISLDLDFAWARGLTIVLDPEPKASASHSKEATISVQELAVPEDARNAFAAGKKKLYADKNAQAALRDFQFATAKAPKFYEAYYEPCISPVSFAAS